MRLNEAVSVLARRLAIKSSRVGHIASRLQDTNHLSKVEGSRRFPTGIGDPEFVTLFLAALCAETIGGATSAVETFGSLTNAEGQRLDRFLEQLIFSPPRHINYLIARQNPPGVSITVDGQHQVFGAEATEHAAQTARIVPGATMAAIASEARGSSPADADALAALQKSGFKSE